MLSQGGMLSLDLLVAAALNPVYYARLSGLPTPDKWQRRILRSKARRKLVLITRQGGKSTTASVKSNHKADSEPESLSLILSPSLRQSSELFRKVREGRRALGQPVEGDDALQKREKETNELLDEVYRQLGLSRDTERRFDSTEQGKAYVDRAISAAALKLRTDNTLSLTTASGSRIVSLPASEGTVRGYSKVALLIEDEASRVPDDLYKSVRPMLAISGGEHWLLTTPWGKRGHFYEEWINGGTGWERYAVTALDCPRITREFLLEEHRALGDHWFNQEYMNAFVETEDQVFSEALVKSAFDSNIEPLFLKRPKPKDQPLPGFDKGVKPLFPKE